MNGLRKMLGANNRGYLFASLLGLVLLGGCGSAGSSAGGTTGGTGAGTGGAGVGGTLPPSIVTVTKSINTAIAATGTVLVTANVKDSYGAAVADGTNVTFSTDLAGTTVTASALTVGGNATATFNANNVAGTATVTATAAGISGFTTISILPSAPASITVASLVPTSIGVKGGGLAESTIVTFNVVDAFNNPVTDGVVINFNIGTPLGGGERISPASSTTVSGQVSVTVTSGTKAGLLGVTATEAASGISTTASVPIEGGPGVANNFSIATQKIVFEGYDLAANTNDFTMVLGDIFGNPVKTGTSIIMQTELGTISSAATDAAGVAVATYTTLGNDPGLKTRGLVPPFGKVGYLTVLAMASGREPFVDNNNNGIYDAGDTFTPALHDYGEPFLDANESGAFEVGEFFFDSNGDGVYTGPNGVHDDVTTIWTSMVVVLSTLQTNIQVNGGACPDDLPPVIFPSRLVTVVDANCNPVDSGGNYTAAIDTQPSPVGTLSGTGTSSLPFSEGFVVASPTLPIAVPVFNNSTYTGSTSLSDTLKFTVTTPSRTNSLGGQ